MDYSYDRTRTAARNPLLAPITRGWSRWKKAYAALLTREMGEPWEASDWTNAEDFSGTFKTTFRAFLSAVTPAPRIEFEVWARRDGGYAVSVTGMKAGRGVAHTRTEVTDVEDLKNPGKFITAEFTRKYKDSLGGSFEDEFKSIRDYGTKLLLDAQQALETAEDIAGLVRGDILKNADALKELTWSLSGHRLDSNAKYLMDTLRTIQKEMGIRDD